MAQTLTRTFPDGDYPDRLDKAMAAYDAAFKDEQKNGVGMLLATEQPASEILRAEYEALKAEAEADAAAKGRIVTLKALGRKQWRPLKEKHPPRVGDDVDEDTAKGDRLASVNTDSVEDDLVFASVISPEFGSRAEFDEWADDLSEGEWNTLVRDAWRLVNVAKYDPKSLPQLRTQTQGES